MNKKAIFEYPDYVRPDNHPDYTAHIGQRVEVVRQLTNEECDPECQPMYEIKAEDGWIGNAREGELRFLTATRETGEFRHVAACCVLYKEGGILMGRRKAGHPVDGDCWEFPGGAQEGTEKVSECMRRETAEECGIHPVGAEFVGWFDHEENWVLFVYCARTIQDPKIMEPDTIDEWRWVNPEDMPQPERAAVGQIVKLARPFIQRQEDRYHAQGG